MHGIWGGRHQENGNPSLKYQQSACQSTAESWSTGHTMGGEDAPMGESSVVDDEHSGVERQLLGYHAAWGVEHPPGLLLALQPLQLVAPQARHHRRLLVPSRSHIPGRHATQFLATQTAAQIALMLSLLFMVFNSGDTATAWGRHLPLGAAPSAPLPPFPPSAGDHTSMNARTPMHMHAWAAPPAAKHPSIPSPPYALLIMEGNELGCTCPSPR